MKKLFTLFLALVASVGTMFASTKIGVLYYKLNATNQTAEVTSKPSGKYSGTISIPNTVDYQSITYNVTSIGNDAFWSCSGMTSLAIGSNVAKISESAFWFCSGLTTIIIDEENPVFDSRDNCNAIIETASNTLLLGCINTTIPGSVMCIGDNAFRACSGLMSVTFPNGLTCIGERAFFDCTNLTSVIIPNSVTNIKEGAFMGCSALTSILVDVDNLVYDSRDNCNAIIETASNTLLFGCKNTIIPNSVTSIGNYAFSECIGLTNIIIPDSVLDIGRLAFYNCTGLASLTIGSSVTSIKDAAFAGCSDLKNMIVYAIIPPTIEGDAFFDVNRQIPVYVPDECVEVYAKNLFWSEFNIQGISQMPQAIDNVSSLLQKEDRSRLVLHDNHVLILCGDHTYTLTGQELR